MTRLQKQKHPPPTTHDPNDSHTGSSSDNDEIDMNEPIWYFGYGPMVHPTVRQRRGVQVSHAQAAVLRDHRLTFAFGGVASVVPQTGYDVHGVVMQCRTQDDWEKLQASEGGYYPVTVPVYPYESNRNTYTQGNGQRDESAMPVLDVGGDKSDESDENSKPSGVPLHARVFIVHEYDGSKLDHSIDRLPQERYLRLIAEGLAQYHGDEDYISDQIMGVAFKPSRKLEEYATFPALTLPPVPPLVLSVYDGNASASAGQDFLKYPSTISTTETESIDEMGSSHASYSHSLATTESQCLYQAYDCYYPATNHPNLEASRDGDDTDLPKITLAGYERLCQSLPDIPNIRGDNEHDENDFSMAAQDLTAASYPAHMLFLMGGHVLLIHNHPGPKHPGAMWFQSNAHAKLQDVTYYLHQTHVDPDIPFCDTEQDVTILHQLWAENLLVESIAQGLTVYRVFNLADDLLEEEEEASIQRLQTFLSETRSSEHHLQYDGDDNSTAYYTHHHSIATTVRSVGSENYHSTSASVVTSSTTASTKDGKKARRRKSGISRLTSKIKKELKLAAASVAHPASRRNHK